MPLRLLDASPVRRWVWGGDSQGARRPGRPNSALWSWRGPCSRHRGGAGVAYERRSRARARVTGSSWRGRPSRPPQCGRGVGIVRAARPVPRGCGKVPSALPPPRAPPAPAEGGGWGWGASRALELEASPVRAFAWAESPRVCLMGSGLVATAAWQRHVPFAARSFLLPLVSLLM